MIDEVAWDCDAKKGLDGRKNGIVGGDVVDKSITSGGPELHLKLA